MLNLWEVDVNLVFETPLPALLPFVPVLDGGDEEGVIRRALGELRRDQTLNEMEPLLALFAAYVLESGVVRQIMRWDMTILRENPLMEDLIQLGVLEGEAKGRQEDVIEILAYRFGPVPDDLRTRITGLRDPAILAQLPRRALSASSLEEFRAALSG